MFAKAQAMFIYVEMYTVDYFKSSSFTVLNMEKKTASGVFNLLFQIFMYSNIAVNMQHCKFFPLCVPSWEPISKYINEQYEKFLKEEVNIARKKRIPDTRVHCCLYFISPTGHS